MRLDVTPAGWPAAPSKALRWCIEDVICSIVGKARGLEIFSGAAVEIELPGPLGHDLLAVLQQQVAARFEAVREC